MKKGDVVTIGDSSFSKSVINGELVHEGVVPCKSGQYKIIETGCGFPHTYNNTVIQAIGSDKVVFIEERFLRLAEPAHKVMIEMVSFGVGAYGKVIEISDKLYKEIKRDTQTQ